MHGDEAVHAVKFSQLWEHGYYKYDPDEYHGPTLYYFTLAWAKLTGAPADIRQFHDSILRSVIVVFGVGIILLLAWMSDGLGRSATVISGLLVAVSPAMVYYSRYYIHEMLLVFFATLTLAAGWRYSQSGRLRWAVLMGVGIGLMQGSKETFVFTLAAMGGAWGAVWLWQQIGNPLRWPGLLRARPIALALFAWGVMVVLFFSSFFTNWHGVLDSVLTYGPWIHRAGGASPHANPWNFYFIRLGWFHAVRGPVFTEALILGLSVVGMIAAVTGYGLGAAHKGFARFLTLFTLALTALYTVISYKTPWCLLNFWVGNILLAGLGAAALLQWFRGWAWKVFIGLLLLAGLAHLAYQARLANTEYCADSRNPYVYAHTSEDFVNLNKKLQSLGDVLPGGRDLVVKVMSPESDYWPIPWYLRDFSHAGYWNEIPEDPNGDIMVVSTKLQSGVATTLLLNDIKDLPGLIAKLTAHSEPVSDYIWRQLGDSLRTKLAAFQPGSTGELAALNMALVQQINSLITGANLADEVTFDGLALRPTTATLRQSHPQGEKIARLNRLLLEDAFSKEINRSQAGLDDASDHIMVQIYQMRRNHFFQLFVRTDFYRQYLERRKGLPDDE